KVTDKRVRTSFTRTMNLRTRTRAESPEPKAESPEPRAESLLNAEGEQYIPRRTAETHIARVHEDHTVDDYRAGSVDRSATSLDAVHRLVVLQRVEVPEECTIASRVRAQMTILRPGEHDPRDRRHGSELSRAAVWPRPARGS